MAENRSFDEVMRERIQKQCLELEIQKKEMILRKLQ